MPSAALAYVDASCFADVHRCESSPPPIPVLTLDPPNRLTNHLDQPTTSTNLPTKPTKVGNQGYLVFSGVYGVAELKPHFAEFCAWLGTADVAVGFIAGHFNTANGEDDVDDACPGCSTPTLLNT